jgi:hypothetical protein
MTEVRGPVAGRAEEGRRAWVLRWGLIASLALASAVLTGPGLPPRSGPTDALPIPTETGLTVPSVPVAPSEARVVPAVARATIVAARDDVPDSYRDGCHLDFRAVQPAVCTYGDPDASRTAVLFGDSHAAQWLPALDVIASERGWRLVVYTKTACPPYAATVWDRTRGRVYSECDTWRRRVFRELTATKPDLVFVGGARRYLRAGDGDGPPRMTEVVSTARIRDMLERLHRSAASVWLLGDTPWLPGERPGCSELATPADACAFDVDSTLDPAFARIERNATIATGSQVLSINDWICPGRRCPIVDDGVTIYRDAHHITATYMAALAPRIGARIDTLVGSAYLPA